jgi:hypothetical protein
MKVTKAVSPPSRPWEEVRHRWRRKAVVRRHIFSLTMLDASRPRRAPSCHQPLLTSLPPAHVEREREREREREASPAAVERRAGAGSGQQRGGRAMDLRLAAAAEASPTPPLPMLLVRCQCATGYPCVGSVFFDPVEREMPAARLPSHHARRRLPSVPCPSPSAVARGGLRGAVRGERIEGREWRNEWRR